MNNDKKMKELENKLSIFEKRMAVMANALRQISARNARVEANIRKIRDDITLLSRAK